MATTALTEGTFEPAVSGDGIVLVDFWASRGGPCRDVRADLRECVDEASGHRVRQGRHRGRAEPGRRGRHPVNPHTDGLPGRHPGFSQPGALPAKSLEQVIAAVRELDMDDVRAKLVTARVAMA
jgi:thioredoxin 1